jgi:hypothetical protein
MSDPEIVIENLVIHTDVDRGLDAFIQKAAAGFRPGETLTLAEAEDVMQFSAHLSRDELRAALADALDAALPKGTDG